MTVKERILHSVLFEIIALILMVGLASLVTDKNITHLGGLALVLSLIAMVWNYVFNLLFDRVFGNRRIDRGLKLRIVHSLAFELGLIAFTLPLIMWALELDLLTVLLMDIGAMLFFLLYALAFNWLYDWARFQLYAVEQGTLG